MAAEGPQTGAVSAGGPSSGKDTLPWVEKYRPESLDDLIAHEDIIATINTLVDKNKLPHLLLYGPPGTGKTSTIMAVAKRLYGDKLKAMTLELNASDDRGISVVQDRIKPFAATRFMFSSQPKLIVLDEADAMTSAAQAALRRIIEKYTKNVRFCLICNYVSKIIPALQSRCTRFRFAPLKRAQIESRLRFVVDSEGLVAEENGIRAILRLASGDMRRVLNILQATAMSAGTITQAAVYATTGDPLPADIKAAAGALLNKSFAEALGTLQDMATHKGLSLADILTNLVTLINAMRFPPPVRAFLLEKLADVEYRLASCMDEELQTASLVSAFVLARDMMGSA